ncbi:hypothetical protein BDV12DRAFT_31780 [Aspergillus spectabilis]
MPPSPSTQTPQLKAIFLPLHLRLRLSNLLNSKSFTKHFQHLTYLRTHPHRRAPLPSPTTLHRNLSSNRPPHSHPMSTSSKPLPTDLPIHTFPTPLALESFLEKNHTTSPGIYIKLARKSTGIPSITAPEAVQVVLCFGWIDGRGQSIDSEYWLVRYTPRRAKSLWSAKNVATITELISEGKVRPMGLEAVEAAKRDGRWERAYDGPASIGVPGDLEEALNKDKKAKRIFEGLNRTGRYSVLHPLQTGAVSTRRERIQGIVEMLARGEVGGLKPKVSGKGSSKSSPESRTFKVEKKSTAKGKAQGKAKTNGKSAKEVAVKASKRVESDALLPHTRQLRSRTLVK